jgi:cytochrome c553
MDVRDGKRVIVEMTGMLDGKSDQDLADMAAFYDSQSRQLSGSKQIELIGSSISGDQAIEFGASLYRGGNFEVGIPSCAGCHAPNGDGNDPAGYPALGGQHADYIAKQLRQFRDGLRHNDGEAKVMRGVAERMSNREIDALANYIAGLH